MFWADRARVTMHYRLGLGQALSQDHLRRAVRQGIATGGAHRAVLTWSGP